MILGGRTLQYFIFWAPAKKGHFGHIIIFYVPNATPNPLLDQTPPPPPGFSFPPVIRRGSSRRVLTGRGVGGATQQHQHPRCCYLFWAQNLCSCQKDFRAQNLWHTPLSGIYHNSYVFFFELRAMLIFSWRPQYIKTHRNGTRLMVAASYCETLRMLCNINFNIHLYNTVLRKLVAGYINCI